MMAASSSPENRGFIGNGDGVRAGGELLQQGQYGVPASEAPTTRFIASGNPVNGAAGFNSCSAGQLSGTANGNFEIWDAYGDNPNNHDKYFTVRHDRNRSNHLYVDGHVEFSNFTGLDRYDTLVRYAFVDTSNGGWKNLWN